MNKKQRSFPSEPYQILIPSDENGVPESQDWTIEMADYKQVSSPLSVLTPPPFPLVELLNMLIKDMRKPKEDKENKRVLSSQELPKSLSPITITLLKFLTPAFNEVAKLPRNLVRLHNRSFSVTKDNYGSCLSEAKTILSYLTEVPEIKQISRLKTQKKLGSGILLLVILICAALFFIHFLPMPRSDINMIGLLEQWNHTVIDDTLNMTCRDWVAPFQNKTNCDISAMSCVQYPCDIVNETKCGPLRSQFSQACNDNYSDIKSVIAYLLLTGGLGVAFLAFGGRMDRRIDSRERQWQPKAQQVGKFLSSHGLWPEQPTKLEKLPVSALTREITSFQTRITSSLSS